MLGDIDITEPNHREIIKNIDVFFSGSSLYAESNGMRTMSWSSAVLEEMSSTMSVFSARDMGSQKKVRIYFYPSSR